MSYILDALRRAEAERQRGQPPGLHQVVAPVPPSAAGHANSAGGRQPLRWMAAAAVLVVAAGATLLLLRREAPAPMSTAGPTTRGKPGPR